jgi:pyridoxine 5-phosphate synthase
MRGALQTRMNLEMACTDAMIALAVQVRPQDVCLVPEKRVELTTEGGLDVIAHYTTVSTATQRLQQAGIRVSLFIDPDPAQLDAAARMGAPVVELHTGAYAEAQGAEQARELARIQQAAPCGKSWLT